MQKPWHGMGGGSGSIYSPMVSALVCPDKFKGTLSAPGRGARDGGRVAHRRVRRGRRAARSPTGAKARSTRCSRRAAARADRQPSPGPLGDPVTAEWGLLPGGTAVIEMARASGLALVVNHNDACARRRAAPVSSSPPRSAPARAACSSAVGGSASTDGGLAAVEALGWSFGAVDVTVACDVSTPFLDAARVFGPQKGATGGAGLAAHPPARTARRRVRDAHGGRRARARRVRARRAGSPAGSRRSGRGWSRGSTSSPTPPGSSRRSTASTWW